MAYTTIDDPTAYFQVKTYTGNGSTNAITFDGNTNMQPDFVWIKDRDTSQHHRLADVVRGVKKNLKSDTADAENTPDSNNGLQSFDSNGFTLTQDSSDHGYNASGSSQVSWNWKAGGTASSNTDGSITSSVSASTTAGFSIVSYTGTGSNATVGHGLSSAPSMIIFKARGTGNWLVYHQGIGNTHGVFLNTTSAKDDDATYFQDTDPTSSVFSIGTSTLVNDTNPYIAYCFAEKKGYSKFGSYTGNGNADGTFVYTGFKPAFVITKKTSGTSPWGIHDNKRDPFNEVDELLEADTSAALSDSTYGRDYLSNGFKIRTSSSGVNGSGDTFIYMAFAESPFVTSTGIPTVGR